MFREPKERLETKQEVVAPPTPIPWNELAPPSGSTDILELTFPKLDHKPILYIKSFDFSKDEKEATGSGKITLWYDYDSFLNLKQGDDYLVKLGWSCPDGKQILKEFCSGILGEVDYKGAEITVNIYDYGKKLEETESVTYTQKKRSFIMKDIIEKKAGLKANIDFGGLEDDTIDYTSTAPTSDGEESGNCICDSFLKVAGCNPEIPYRPEERKCWVNKCPVCGKEGTLVIGHDQPEQNIRCSACDCDYCGKTGWEMSSIYGPNTPGPSECSPEKRLKACSSTSTTTTTSTPQTSTGTSSNVTATGGGGGSNKVDQIMKEASKFRYQSGCSNADCLESNGWGECWAMSDWLYKKLTAAGIACRIIQYDSGYTSNHRTVQVKDSNGNWVDPEYTGNGININFNAWPETNPKPGQFTVQENSEKGVGVGAGAIGTDQSTDSGKTYWDMLLDLCDPLNKDLQVFVWLDTVYVQKVPNPANAVLSVDASHNLVHDSLELKEGDIEAVNTIIVQYGNKKELDEVKATYDELSDKYGEKAEIITQNKLTAEEALILAENELGKKVRDSNFEVGCEIIGSPEWYICRWAKLIYPERKLNETLYIDKFDHKIDSAGSWLTDLTLLRYRPTLKEEETTEAGGGDLSSLEAIAKEEAKYADCQNAPRSSNYLNQEKDGCTDCWGDSQWLYNKLSAAGIQCRVMGFTNKCGDRHAWIEINMGNGWEEYPYKKYNSQHFGNIGCGTPFVLIEPGKGTLTMEMMLATGY